MPSGPIKRENALTVARLRMLGATQDEASNATGTSIRTIQRWEQADWWPEICDDARTSVHEQLEAYAMRTLLAAVRDHGDAQSARWMLERLRPDVWGQRGGVDVRIGDGDSDDAATLIIDLVRPTSDHE